MTRVVWRPVSCWVRQHRHEMQLQRKAGCWTRQDVQRAPSKNNRPQAVPSVSLYGHCELRPQSISRLTAPLTLTQCWHNAGLR